MGGRWPFTEEKIASRLKLIEPYIFRKTHPLPAFRFLPLPEASVEAPICADPSGWDEIPHNSYWGGADLNFILKSSFAVPAGWNAAHIALYMPLGVMGDIFNHPEALVHVDTKPIGSADRYHHTIPLDPIYSDGKSHTLSLQGWTGLAGWPPDPDSNSKLFMGEPMLVEIDPALHAFHAYASSVLDAAKVLGPDAPEHVGLIKALDDAFRVLDTRAPIGDNLYASVAKARDVLDAGVQSAGKPRDERLHGIGHAHMDIAYLWPVDQIRLKNARTYSNVLRLMEQDPDFKFSHSQSQLYALVEQDYPEIFQQIKDRVAEGRWEVMGGMWVEPDLNIPGPEALVRQLTLGRAYFKDTFGEVETPVLWLPDTFGFPAQIPQLMRHAGLEYFVTNKLNWNQKNKVPWSTHHWEGLDGSRVLAHILTTPRDVQYLPFPTNYKSDLSAYEVLGTALDPSVPEDLTDLPICYGYGDGGGGPTDGLLHKARAYSDMPGMPKFKMSTVRDALEALDLKSDSFEVWRGEHYMEGHRGTLTSQGWIKRANRLAERALHEAEALSAMAGLSPDLTKTWQLLCQQQFHDIVTGTSVPSVFEDARRDFALIRQAAEKVALDAAEALSAPMDLIGNTSPITGPRVVEVATHVSGQRTDGGELLYFDRLPAYSTVPVSEATSPEVPVSILETENGPVIKNQFLRVSIAPNGQITEVFDKDIGRNVLKGGARGNVLQAFEDRPICWDAWDIDPSFEDRMDVVEGEFEFEVVETGPLRAAVRVTTKWRKSTFVQTIQLTANSRRIDFATEVDWHERHTLLKAAFPTCIQADEAEFDIQWGSVRRSTKRETSFDAARFEVPAQKWARLCDNVTSVAVLNDCKYGYDVRDDTIRITLLKSSTSPDPEADQGLHRFTYSLLTHSSSDRSMLDHEAYALNTPIRCIPAGGGAPPQVFVEKETCDCIVETVVPATEDATYVLRVYENKGVSSQITLKFGSHIESAALARFDETMIKEIGTTENTIPLTLGPSEIVNLKVRLIR